jgi:pyrroloquinoline quinone biosynthesis protein E
LTPPVVLIAELTHRCPLSCAYCSNPLELKRAGDELDTTTWRRIIDEAAALGVLHIHFTGGEPLARRDISQLIQTAAAAGLYTNLITSGIQLSDQTMAAIADAGIDHIQLSFQDVGPTDADRSGGYAGGHARKLAAAARITSAGIPLTLNFVVHRGNVDRTDRMIAMGETLGAQRIEIAHAQYHGWALVNRAALMPAAAQLEVANQAVREARERLNGQVVIDYVVPDYFAARPKACMGGWGRQALNVTPDGRVLPCHAAETLPGFDFPNVRDRDLSGIWYESDAFQRYRGTDWAPEPCKSCERLEIDFGGCRCQAFALTGDAGRTDPACKLSADRYLIDQALAQTPADSPLIQRRLAPSRQS